MSLKSWILEGIVERGVRYWIVRTIVRRKFKKIQEAMKMNEQKPGWKTTEFWGKVLVQVCTIWGMVGGMVEPKTAVVITGVLEGVYNVMRSLQKCPEITTFSKTEVNKSEVK